MRGRKPLRVLVANGQPLISLALARLLQTDDRLSVVAETRDGPDTVEKACSLRPDVVVVDLKMPALDGIEVTRQILAAHPDMKVLVLSSVETDSSILRGLEAGASGYMSMDSQPETLVSSILAMAAGARVMSTQAACRVSEMLTGVLAAKEYYDGLTTREVQVLRLLAAGMTNNQIADRLRISDKTVRNHATSINHKLQTNNRGGATLYAFRKGLLPA